MRTYIVNTPVSIPVGALVSMTEEQAARRVNRIEKVDADIYRVIDRPVMFKAGEIIGVDNVVIGANFITPVDADEEPESVDEDDMDADEEPESVDEDDMDAVLDDMSDDELREALAKKGVRFRVNAKRGTLVNLMKGAILDET